MFLKPGARLKKVWLDMIEGGEWQKTVWGLYRTVCDKNNSIRTEWKGQIWHFGSVKAQKAQAQVYTLQPKPTRFTIPHNLPFHHLKQVYTAALFHLISFFSSLFSLLRSAAESIELKKHWIHPSRKCAPNTAVLWPGVTAFCERLSGGAAMATV